MSITDDQLNNEIDLAQDLTNRTTTNIIVDSANLANNDLLQYDSSSRQFEPRTPAEMGLYYPGGADVPITDGGTGASTASDARTNLGLGTIATQASSSVTITGGTITGITDLAVADGGTGVSTLTGIVKGNGTSAFSAAVQGTDYYAPGGTDVAVADGGTGASTLTGVLIGNGTSAITAESPLTVAKGGTGVVSNTAYAVLCGGTSSTSPIQSVASVGSLGHVLVSNGAGALPSFTDVSLYPGSWVLVSSQTASSSATIDFTGLSSTYSLYMISISELVPATDNTTLQCRIGTGAGPTYASTNEYDYCNANVHTTGTEVLGGAISAASMLITQTGSATTNAGSSTGENVSARIWLPNPSEASLYQTLYWEFSSFSSGAVPALGMGAGVYKAATAVTAIRFHMSSDAIASGTFNLYGLKAS